MKQRKRRDLSDNDPRTCGACGTPLDVPTGRQIREGREAMRLSREAFAALVDSTVEAVRSVERGQSNATPAMCKVLRIESTGGVVRITDPKVATSLGNLLAAQRLVERSLEELEIVKRELASLLAGARGE